MLTWARFTVTGLACLLNKAKINAKHNKSVIDFCNLLDIQKYNYAQLRQASL